MTSVPTDPEAWPVENDPPGNCCGCDLHTILVEGSFRTRALDEEGEGDFGEWSAYSTSHLFLSAGNSGPGGSETQMRYKLTTNTSSGAEVGPSVVRYRGVTSVDVGEGETLSTQYTSGEVQIWEIPELGGSVEFYLPGCSVGETAIMMSGPAGGPAGMSFKKFQAKLKKQGFTQYDGGGEPGELRIYRSEFVTDASEPGCLATGRPARTYEGGQAHTEVLATPENGYLLDPAGTYVDTRSADLVEDKHASVRYTLASDSVRFGISYTPTETIFNMTEGYKCGVAIREKFLQLTLSAYYPTADMTNAVDAAIDAQIDALPADEFNSGIAGAGPLVVHRFFLSTDETIYDRVKCQEFKGSSGAGGLKTLLNPGASATRTIKVDTSIRNYTSNVITEGNLTLSAPFYAVNDLGPLGAGGRDTRPYDPDLDEDPPPVTHEFYPDTDPETRREVIWSNARARGHIMLVEALPFVEPHSVMADGWDT